MLLTHHLEDLVRYRTDRNPLSIEVDDIVAKIKVAPRPIGWTLLISGSSMTFSNARRSRHIKLDISGRKVYVDVIRNGQVKSTVAKHKTLALAYENAIDTLKELGDRELKIQSKRRDAEAAQAQAA